MSSTSQTLGVTFPFQKWIMIGAMQTSEETCENKTKGTITHEICHYVIDLVYQNHAKPYYEENCPKFNEIVDDVGKILEQQKQLRNEQNEKSFNNSEEVKKIEEVISIVYDTDCYEINVRHQELIVRPAHIHAQFHDNLKNVGKIEGTYKLIFDFFYFNVLPEIEKLSLKNRQHIQFFNDMIGTLYDLQNSSIKIQAKNNLDDLINRKITIIETNAPQMLFLDIYMKLKIKYRNLLDVKSIFITQQNLEQTTVYNNINKILQDNSNLNTFVNCTKVCETSIKKIFAKDSKLCFITSKKNKNKNLIRNIQENYKFPAVTPINYNWIDLTDESQKLLLQTKVNFQNNLTFSLSELILNESDPQQQEKSISEDLTIIIDEQLLNMLVDKSEIKINQITLENSEDIKFRILFQTRNIIKKHKTSESRIEIDETKKMTLDEMLEDVKDNKFVLISDKAGSGKSWILKNVSNKLRDIIPNKWITYVDLKSFIHEFKAQKNELEFAVFMTEKILKPKTKYEANIFKKLYKNGKICILFDGFDEIAPDCAEFVTKLFQSFQQNGGNQMWIATRDYFEVDLKVKLKLDAVYKLDEFKEEHGVELIATSWVLSEIMENDRIIVESDILNHIKTSQNLNDYKETAGKLIKKIPKKQDNSIGLPQFYKMIADSTQDNKDATIDFTTFKIFKECVNKQYERWSQQKGPLRSKASTESQSKELNYHTLHELVAMKSLFPNDKEFCDLRRGALKQWKDEEIIACGILTKIGEIFLFSHETFREYYVAKFILRILMMTRERDDDQVCGYLIQILTIKKYGIIRMFLNEALAEKETLTTIEKKIPKINENFFKNVEEMKNLYYVFWESLENLVGFLLKVLAKGDYEKMKNILLGTLTYNEGHHSE